MTGEVLSATGGGGTGDVVGPASAVHWNLAAFNTTTGKLIMDSHIDARNVAVLNMGNNEQFFNSINHFLKPTYVSSIIIEDMQASGSIKDVVIDIGPLQPYMSPYIGEISARKNGSSDKMMDIRNAGSRQATVASIEAAVGTAYTTKDWVVNKVNEGKGEYYVDSFIPTGNVYPDTTGQLQGGYWIVHGLAVGATYTYTSGALSGSDVRNGYKLLWDGAAGTTGEGMVIMIPPTAVWGGIAGTLSDQTDLQAALDTKGPGDVYRPYTPGNYKNNIVVFDVSSSRLKNSGIKYTDVVINPTVAEDWIRHWDGSVGTWVAASAGGGGDVFGPNSSSMHNLATFGDSTGKKIIDSNIDARKVAMTDTGGVFQFFNGPISFWMLHLLDI